MNISKRGWFVAIAGFVLPAAIMLPAVLLVLFGGFKLGTFTSEPTYVLGGPWYAGSISTLGTFIWISSASICFFSFAVLRARAQLAKQRVFLFQSGLLLLLLTLDDAFRLHDGIFAYGFGIPEKVTYALYVLLTAGLVIGNWRTIMKSEYVLLFLAGAFFAVSLLLDTFHVIPGRASFFFEDASKLVGISLFLTYYSLLGLDMLTKGNEAI